LPIVKKKDVDEDQLNADTNNSGSLNNPIRKQSIKTS